MLTTEKILETRQIPKLKDITLKQVQEYHDEYLINKIYRYTLRPNKKKETFDIDIRFFKDSLPHLLGIHKVVPSYNKKLYAGQDGYDKIFNEDITIEKLENFDKQRSRSEKQFPKTKNRITHYFLIDYLMDKCKIIKFDASKVNGNCNLKSDFILFNEELGVKLQLGVVKEAGKPNLYVPETFIPKKLSARDKDRLTAAPPQTYMNIENKVIINLIAENAREFNL